ncbi:MAG: hypothetical protein Ta2A_21150 [Treponemataceae bacterium]|nr:MAG: hypothetical protein Ta2A_21150 [Treponemataceae bacterium]
MTGQMGQMRLCLRVLTFLLALIALSMLVPIACALALGEHQVIRAFALPAIFFFVLPFICYPLTAQRKYSSKSGKSKKSESGKSEASISGKSNISLKGGYVLVALCYAAACFAGAIPLVLSGCVASIPDAIFESVSGFSTTGATVLPNIDALPMSINVWRCELHWLGGMGIIALTVALLPLLGIGGFQLYKAETTGPEKGKITPRIAATAKILWLIYLTFTVCGTFSLKLSGMDFFDALAHSFSILGAGGFSTHSASLAFFDAPAINRVCAFLMFLTGVNYALYYYALSGRIREVRDNTELKVYVALVVTATLVLCAVLFPQYFSIRQINRPIEFSSFLTLIESSFFSRCFAAYHHRFDF